MTARQRAWLLPPAALSLAAGILLGRGMSSLLLPLLACLPASRRKDSMKSAVLSRTKSASAVSARFAHTCQR